MTSLQRTSHQEATRRAATRVRPVIDLMREEFLEMPDMALSVDQASRLWAVERSLVSVALERLVDEGLLRTSRDRFVLAQ